MITLNSTLVCFALIARDMYKITEDQYRWHIRSLQIGTEWKKLRQLRLKLRRQSQSDGKLKCLKLCFFYENPKAKIKTGWQFTEVTNGICQWTVDEKRNSKKSITNEVQTTTVYPVIFLTRSSHMLAKTLTQARRNESETKNESQGQMRKKRKKHENDLLAEHHQREDTQQPHSNWHFYRTTCSQLIFFHFLAMFFIHKLM